jgi:single-strand DNA-binding protein
MAQDINNVVVTGRLADDAVLKQTKTGQNLCNLRLVNNRGKRKVNDSWVDQDPNYFTVIVWGKTAENLKPYLVKGKQIAVSGRLQQRSYQLPEETKKRSVYEIVAQNIQLLGGGGGAGSSGGGPGRTYSQAPAAPVESSAPAPEVVEESFPPEYEEDPSDQDKGDGIPF